MGEVHGSCHCGALRVFYASDGPMAGRRCGCGFCRRHGSLYTTDPAGWLRIEAAAGAMNRYRFGQRRADFLLCGHCGTLVAVTAEIDGTLRGVVNLAVMDPPMAPSAEVPVLNFDAETEDERTARRRRNWIGRVTITDGSLIPSGL
jgi:hypothetical protein